jgi:LysM repeat protein
MKQRLFALVLVALIASLLVAGCDRPAPLPPAVPTSTGQIPFPIPDKQTVIPQIGTQTAIAKTPQVVGVTATQQPNQPQATKAPVTQPTVAATKAPVVVVTATPKPVIVVPSATPGRPTTYTIQSGDTFYCLARRFNLNVGDFLGLNGLGNSSLAVIGQVVKIPQSGSWGDGSRALKAHPATYIVQDGESLNKIACFYGDVDPNAILYANNLKGAGDIQSGMTLNIP